MVDHNLAAGEIFKIESHLRADGIMIDEHIIFPHALHLAIGPRLPLHFMMNIFRINARFISHLGKNFFYRDGIIADCIPKGNGGQYLDDLHLRSPCSFAPSSSFMRFSSSLI